ncbi:MAG: 4-hydroxy-3-methylbut-2-enyl diphosphate reductase [Alistipes sp.]|nr:4-hydroxy-3-methylbut-2-enyl diphosphate reductase [Alistipes sp.]
MLIEIDKESGFCFGVVGAISKAEDCVDVAGGLVSLGDIVHNGAEVARLEALGLETVPEQTDLAALAGRRVLIRAHGEPPETYRRAAECGVELIDATCPVVARLQKTVAGAWAEMERVGGQVVIFGRRGHAEVRGLAGQAGGRVTVVEGEADLDGIDFARPIYFLAQTTSSLAEFRQLGEEIRRRAIDPQAVEVRDTICRQVAGREEHLAEFARRFDVVVFVSGAKSSNGRVLFDAVRAANPRSHKIERPEELRTEWFDGAESVGICGATSTPRWLMEQTVTSVTELVI